MLRRRARSRRRKNSPFPLFLQQKMWQESITSSTVILFDRRRDLAIPTSFLLDREGMIVKVYQGPISPERLLEDVRAVPTTTAGRMQKAMPLGGVLYQGAFQRNDFTYGVALFNTDTWNRPPSHFNRSSPRNRMTPKAITTLERSI